MLVLPEARRGLQAVALERGEPGTKPRRGTWVQGWNGQLQGEEGGSCLFLDVGRMMVSS